MSVIIAEHIEHAYAERPILRGLDISVQDGEHVGLVGVNGGGKSTLMQILAGRLSPDHGEIRIMGRASLLDQDPDLPGATVGDVMRDALSWHEDLKAEYEAALQAEDLDRAQLVQARLDQDGWDLGHRVDAILDRVGAPVPTATVATLSGGERRRVALAAALLHQPDVLLLDEPTNHLDADTTEWLESWIRGFRGAIVLVTHDRYLLEAVADRIVEIDLGVAVSYPGSYADYLISRAERAARMDQQRERHLSLVAREAAWAARSPSARSTKQRARLQRLDALQESIPELSDRSFRFSFDTGVPKGSTLIECHGVHKGFGDRKLLVDVDLTVRPGDRLAVVGPNGAGKSTLLKLIEGRLQPDAGEVLKGARLQIGLLDQARMGLSEDHTVIEAAGDGREVLDVGGRTQHVASFLERFAFPRDMFEQRVSGLSGGERARLLLARLMLTGANLLLLDEPTNDLDLLTLRTLEEALLGYDGGVVVVTHDRAFVDRVCTGVRAIEEGGRLVAYADRAQHVAAKRARQARPADAIPTRKVAAPQPKPRSATGRLSYKEREELAGLPGAIETIEAEQQTLESSLSDPASYRDQAEAIAGWTARLEALAGEIEALYARWEALEERKS